MNQCVGELAFLSSFLCLLDSLVNKLLKNKLWISVSLFCFHFLSSKVQHWLVCIAFPRAGVLSRGDDVLRQCNPEDVPAAVCPEDEGRGVISSHIWPFSMWYTCCIPYTSYFGRVEGRMGENENYTLRENPYRSKYTIDFFVLHMLCSLHKVTIPLSHSVSLNILLSWLTLWKGNNKYIEITY